MQQTDDIPPAAVAAATSIQITSGRAVQAIETKFVGSTNNALRQIRVKCLAKIMFVSWDHALGVEGNHNAAAMELEARLARQVVWRRQCRRQR